MSEPFTGLEDLEAALELQRKTDVALPSVKDLESFSLNDLARLAANCLKLLSPGRQSIELFTQLSRISTQPIVEVVPLRPRRGKLPEVLLAKRPEGDRWWANKWALPGGVLLPVDEVELHDFTTPVKKILDDDFDGNVVVSGTVSAFDVQRRISRRGNELAVICWAEVGVVESVHDIKPGLFYKPEQILHHEPDGGIVDGHRENIGWALESYQRYAAAQP